MKKQKADHEIDRIIVGNQLTIMRALELMVPPKAADDLRIRVHDIKDWWRREYGEEVGFSSAYDKPVEQS
jgi:hypothetical protein